MKVSTHIISHADGVKVHQTEDFSNGDGLECRLSDFELSGEQMKRIIAAARLNPIRAVGITVALSTGQQEVAMHFDSAMALVDAIVDSLRAQRRVYTVQENFDILTCTMTAAVKQEVVAVEPQYTIREDEDFAVEKVTHDFSRHQWFISRSLMADTVEVVKASPIRGWTYLRNQIDIDPGAAEAVIDAIMGQLQQLQQTFMVETGVSLVHPKKLPAPKTASGRVKLLQVIVPKRFKIVAQKFLEEFRTYCVQVGLNEHTSEETIADAFDGNLLLDTPPGYRLTMRNGLPAYVRN